MSDDRIIEDIQRARSLRTRFLVDTPSLAFENTVEMIDRLWPIESAQLDRSRLKSHIYRVDAKAADQADEQKKRLWSALLAKLSLRDWGYADNTGKSKDQLIDELDRDFVLMAKDGLTPYERYVEGITAPAISSETSRHNQSLTPKIRAQMFASGLLMMTPIAKTKGRKRLKPVSEHTVLRTAPFIKSRENWRAGEIYIACKALHAIAVWAADPDTDSADLEKFAQRYRLEDLYVSQSKVAPDSYAAKLAVAITSADHLGSGTDSYAPNDDIARGAFMFYGLYLQAIRGKKIAPAEAPPVFLNKLLELLE